MNVILCCLCFLWETLCYLWFLGWSAIFLSLSLFLLFFFLTFLVFVVHVVCTVIFPPFGNVAFISLLFPFSNLAREHHTPLLYYFIYLFLLLILLLGHTPLMHSPHTISLFFYTFLVLTALQGGNFNLSQYHMMFWLGQLFELG